MKGFVMKITEVLSPVLTGKTAKTIGCSPKDGVRSLQISGEDMD
ncbi:MAG: hypothetical protein PHR68_02420 [Candidatus Gracilibacteria bacterium]|nr:hypothetical protein [Candidatus Gracilibacteria bacterium]